MRLDARIISKLILSLPRRAATASRFKYIERQLSPAAFVPEMRIAERACGPHEVPKRDEMLDTLGQLWLLNVSFLCMILPLICVVLIVGEDA